VYQFLTGNECNKQNYSIILKKNIGTGVSKRTTFLGMAVATAIANSKG
jgi:hypothetical protein